MMNAAPVDRGPAFGTALFDYAPHEMGHVVEQAFCAMDYVAAPEARRSPSSFDGVDLGAISVFRHQGIGRRFGIRQAKHVRSHWVDDFILSLPIDAYIVARQGTHEAQLEPGGFGFLSTLKPFHTSLFGEQPLSSCSSLVVRVSAPLLRERAPAVDELCGLPLTIQSGAGRVMRSLFDLAISEGRALSQSQRAGLGNVLLEAIVNVALESVGEHTLSLRGKPASLARIRGEACDYIRLHLSDPRLSLGDVASHVRVSERYLQSAFAQADKTVATHIRDERLQQCQAALRDPAMRAVSVMDIALTWGFNDASYFSRAYKARFGCSPSAERAPQGALPDAGPTLGA